jgi:lipopolysaccharide biosynthesis regulator YciM
MDAGREDARLAGLRAELAAARDRAEKAILFYEIAVHLEGTSGDLEAARDHYRLAVSTDPAFRPAIFALKRILLAQNDVDPARLAELCGAEERASKAPHDVASALIDHGVVLEDRAQKPTQARPLFERALRTEPENAAAALMLELYLARHGDYKAIGRLAAERAAATKDPVLKQVLTLESAEHKLREGDREGAIAILRDASSAPAERVRVLRALLRIGTDQTDVVLEALDKLALLASEAGKSDGPIASPSVGALPPFRDNASARAWAKVFLWDGARIRIERAGEVQTALRALDRAIALDPDDLSIRLERLDLLERGGDAAGACEEANQIATRLGKTRRAAVAHLRVASLAQRAGDAKKRRAAVEAAFAADPASPLTSAELANLYASEGRHHQRIEWLERAATGVRSGRAFLEGAHLAAAEEKNFARARRLYVNALERGEPASMVRRELYGAALLLAPDEAGPLASELSAESIDPGERSALRFDSILGARSSGAETIRLLEAELARSDRDESPWAAHAARVVGARENTPDFSARAHRALANASAGKERSAHLAALARIHVKKGDLAAAETVLQELLGEDRAHAYARALREEVVRKTSGGAPVAELLFEAGRSETNERVAEILLLRAALIARAGGRTDLAAKACATAMERRPGSIGPRWLAVQVASETRDREALREALSGIAEMRGALAARAALTLAEDKAVDGASGEDFEALLEDESAGTAAALWIVVTSSDRDRLITALEKLVEAAAGTSAAAFFTRALAVFTFGRRTPDASKAVIDRVLRQRGDDPYCRLLALESTPLDRARLPERRDALLALGRSTRDEKLHADLALEAALIDLASGSGRAKEILSEIPADGVAHAFVLDEIVDQANLARRLGGRLAHTSDAAKPALASALGRALLAVGRAPEAVEQLLGVVDRDPQDLSAWVTLRYAARLTALPDVFVRANRVLAQHLPPKRRAGLLEEAGVTLLEELEEPAEAERVLEEALAADAGRLGAFARLKRIYEARNDAEALSRLVSVRVNEADDPTELAALLLEEARIHREAGRTDRAIESLKNLRVLEPAHVPGAALLADVYVTAEQWEPAVDALRELACLDLPAELRSASRFAAARFLQEKLHDPARAFDELAIVERMGFLDEALAARMAQLAELAGRHDEAVRYLARAAELAKEGSKVGYERRAAALHHVERDDQAAAIDAYERALEASPGDAEAIAGISGLVDRTERRRIGSAMIEALMRQLAKGAIAEDTLRRLCRAAAFGDEPDLEWLALSALASLGLAKRDELDALERLQRRAPAGMSGFLTDEAASSLVDSADRGPLRELASLAGDAVLMLEGRDGTSGVAADPTAPVCVEIAEIAGAFGAPLAGFLRGGEDVVDVAAGETLRWVVPQSLERLGADERFAVGVLSFAARTGTVALALRTHEDGAALLYAIARASGNDLPDTPDDAEDIAAPLRDLLEEAARKQIAWIAKQMDPAEDPGAFAHGVERTLLRAGLVACRDLRVVLGFALGLSGTDEPTIEAVAGKTLARDLVRFWLSDAHRSLRRDLGIDLPPEPASVPPEIKPPPPSSRSGFFANVAAPAEWNTSLDRLVEAAMSFVPKSTEHPSVERPSTSELDDRRDLVSELEPAARGAQLAKLLVLDAELSEQANELGAAEKTLARAHRAHPDDVVALRRYRRLRQKAGAHAEAARLLEHEANLPLTNDERALALSLAAANALASDAKNAEALVQRALAMRPRSAGLALVLATLQRTRGAEQEHAESLERAARDVKDEAFASVLLAEAGFANERASDPARARFLFRRAADLDPANVEATLGLARAGLAHGVFEDAFKPLSTLSDSLRDATLADAVRRVAATIAFGRAGRAEQAVRILADATDPIALDVKVAAASASGDNEALSSALEALARAGRRTERALALVRLAELHLAAGDERSVAETLREAASADPTVTVIRALQIEAARKRDDFRTLYRLLRAEGFTPLDGAARALLSSNAEGVERQLLTEASAESDPCAAVLLLDAAKTQADVQRALLLELASRTDREALAVASVLAIHDVRDEREIERFTREVRELVPNDATLVRVLAATTTRTDPARAAPLWLTESELTTGERAAFAATFAGRLLEKTEGDAASAYDRALTADRRYGPAMWSLEAHARRVRDLRTLRSVLGRAANREGSPEEVAERLIRAALVEDELPLDLVARASDAMPEDGCIADLVFRVGGPRIAAHARAELLERQAAEDSPAWTRAVRLRQAAILEEAGDFAAAASACRAVLRTHPDDAFAAYLLDRYEPRAGEGDHVDARLRQAVERAGDDVSRGLALEALAEFFSTRDDRRRDAADAYHAILEKFPSHGPSLRGLERVLMSFDDDLALARHEEQYAKSASPDAALAHTRLALRLYDRSGAKEERAALLAAAFDFAEIDGWLAREVEAASRASGDKRRLVRALEEEIELLQGVERIAAELRAAESVRDSRAPSIAVNRIERLTRQPTTYPVLDEMLARFRRASGAHAKAAESFIAGAKRARAGEWKSALYFEAGTLLADELRDNEAAADAFLQAANAHPGAHTALERLVDLSSNPTVVQRVAEIVVKHAAKGLDRAHALALYDRLARHQSKLGDPAGAKKTLRRAMTIDAANPALLEHLFSICEAEADWTGAAEALDKWARASKEPAVQRTCYLRLADVLERARDLRKAEAAVQKALALGPEDPVAKKRLSEIQRQLATR